MPFYRFYFNKIQILRIISLLVFSVLSIWVGIEFHLFLKSINLEHGYPRPAGVDAWLPISSLMNIRYLFITGEVHKAHPYGVFFLFAAIFVSFIFSKSFCSWVCPFGFLSEILINVRKIIFKRDFNIPAYLDYFLRTIKYILLAFFVYVIFFKMDFISLKDFLDSDYNKVADIKMYYFFANISSFALKTIIVLFILSFFFNFFWCRYLCPYGALMAIAGFLSPFKIKRDNIKCISCGKCAEACPHKIKTDRVKTVLSDDCSFCLLCVTNTAKTDALNVSLIFSKFKLNLLIIPLTILLIFLTSKILAIKLNLFDNNISKKEYQILMLKINELSHPGR